MPEDVPLASLDLTSLHRLYRTGEASPREVLASILKRIATHGDPAVWIDRFPREAVLEEATRVEKRRAAGEALPLYGIPFAVKDNTDVAGRPTTAGCPAFASVATRSAPVVVNLQKAGAVLVGKTNLDQFSTGLAGDRSPYGACRNTLNPAYISGGSSSGSGVAVAAGLVTFALGTDTAGSGRIPAGCNNVVGLKPTPGLLSTQGVFPACRSLDCVSVFALTADDAWAACAAAAGTAPPEAGRDDAPREFTFAVPRDEDLEFFGDAGQEEMFRRAVEQLGRLGGRRTPIDFSSFRRVGDLLYQGPWLAERLAAVGEFLTRHPDAVHPITRAVIEGGAAYSAVDVFKARDALEALREPCLSAFQRADVLVVPTLPALPTLAEVQADSVGWSRRLGTYTNFANLLGLAAVAVPAGFTPQGLPGGLTLLAPGGSDRKLCRLALAWQRLLDLPLGATGRPLPTRPAAATVAIPPPAAEGFVRVAVAGAHLRGQPLHADLLKTGARFVRTCRTAPRYRFVGLMDLAPPRPGLLRDEARSASIRVEIYDLPTAGFGALVASVAPPLSIGTIELSNGEAVKGFLCESYAAARARDITDFGGWLAFLEGRATAPRPSISPPMTKDPQ
jgi:allophanate hydrolase